MKIYLATQNLGKVKEFSQTWLAPFLQSLPKGLREPEETGQTCADNAVIKAKAYSEYLEAPVLSDDSGFFIESLDGYPGVHSSRVIKETGSIDKVFASIEQRVSVGAKAYFETVLCYLDSKGQIHLFKGQLKGVLSFPARGQNGFGYDPIFIPEGYDCTLGQLDPDEKAKISHRARALEKFEKQFHSIVNTD